MTTLNVVTVTVAVQGSPVDTSSPEGNFVFVPNGPMWPGTAGTLPIDPSIQQGHLVNGTASVQLVASDNFSVGVLNWDVIINIRGMNTINVSALPVNYASGSSQSIWDILLATGWSPVAQP